MRRLSEISIEEIRAARDRLVGTVARTPLVPLNVEHSAEIYLKLENLQPIGSFKLRGAGNAILKRPAEELNRGVFTASAGNMAQGVAWCARRLGVDCHVVVPDDAPRTKLDAIRRLGGEVIPVPFDRWWDTVVSHEFPGLDGVFIHPVSDPDVIAGNGTIGLEIIEDLPDVDTVLVPFGGGGLSCGIAAALGAGRTAAKVYGCEVATAAPLSAAWAAGEPVPCVEHERGFVDGIGGKSVLVEMWPLIRSLLAGPLTATIDDIAAAVRDLVTRNRVVAEGAGASSVAVALSGAAGSGKIVCVVSGGNIDSAQLAAILQRDGRE